MSDIFRVQLDKCGVGGVKCCCCNPYRSLKGRKRGGRAQMSRLARTRVKREDEAVFAEVDKD